MKRVFLFLCCADKGTWETPPSEESPLWQGFKLAYEEYVRGHWIHMPNYRGKKAPYADLRKSEEVIQAAFGHRLEKKEQPEWIEGGKMFDYQLEGMKYLLSRLSNISWLYFQWYKQTSAILADEMGLG
jgi:chromodomain-helicase-DNA-binding protein 4